jgi:TetR/AcrR family transcriptional regulator
MPFSSDSNPDSGPIPTRKPGRPRHAEGEGGEVREKLLAAATDLAVEHGFDACGLREIAAHAEVSSGMIAYYFGDRQGLHEAMFQRAFERISGQVRELMSDRGRSGGDRLDELVRIQVSAIAADPWLPRLLMREVLSRGDSPMSDSIGEAVGKGPLRQMIDWLEEEQANHAISEEFDPRMLAMTIASLTGFPFLMLPIVGDHIGLQLDDDFPDRLIKHNQKFLAFALRAQTEDER